MPNYAHTLFNVNKLYVLKNNINFSYLFFNCNINPYLCYVYAVY